MSEDKDKIIKPEVHEIINDFIKCYLIGPMEDVAKADNGVGWRIPLNEEISCRVGPKWSCYSCI